MPREWAVVMLNPRTGGELAVTGWQSISIEENFDGITAKMEIPAAVPVCGAIQELLSDILLYFDHQRIYRLRVVDSEDTLTTEGHTVSFELVNYRKLLGRRVLFDNFERTQDQHLWAWDFIAYTQAFEDLGIRQADDFGPSGQNRSRVVQRGKTIEEAINELAEQDNGFDWWIDMNLRFHCQTPRRVMARDFDLQWGAGVASMTRANAVDTYASVILAIGATNETSLPSGSVYPPPPPVIRELVDKPYGRWAKTVSYSDIVTEGSLIGKAVWHLADSSTLRPQYNLTLSAGIWQPFMRPGMTFTLRVPAWPRFDFKVLARIETVSVELTADGVETVKVACRAETAEVQVTPIDLPEVPGDIPIDLVPGISSPADAVLISPGAPVGRSPTVAFTSDTRSLGAMLARLGSRIARQERST